MSEKNWMEIAASDEQQTYGPAAPSGLHDGPHPILGTNLDKFRTMLAETREAEEWEILNAIKQMVGVLKLSVMMMKSVDITEDSYGKPIADVEAHIDKMVALVDEYIPDDGSESNGDKT